MRTLICLVVVGLVNLLGTLETSLCSAQEQTAAANLSSITVQTTSPLPPPLHEHPTLVAMVQQSNAWRAAVGLPPQTINPQLTQAAQDQAWFMAAHNQMAHDTNGGLMGRVSKVGYGYRSVRENIAWNQRTVPEVFEAWKNSPGHWVNMTANETEIGCGYALSAKGEGYWVVVYGTPK